MSEYGPDRKRWKALKAYPTLAAYAGAGVAAWVALSLWTLSPALHHEPIAFFLAAVVVAARFFGFGPALFCSLLSTACLRFVVFQRIGLASDTGEDLQRLGVFLVIAVLVGTLTRQKTNAELRVERALREMAAIVECSEDAIFSIHTDGTIATWNRGAEHLYGYSAEEAVGAPVLMLAPLERREEVEHNLQVIKQGGRLDSHQTERVRKDGQRVPVLLACSPLRNRKGEIVGASVIARDLSAQKFSEEAIWRSEKLAAAGRLAASVAHEINNPLEAVLNLLYLARHDPNRAEEYLTMAEREVTRVASLAQQTLGFVRDSNTPGPVNPATIADEILQLYSRKLESKKIRVSRRYTSNCEIAGYAGELRQLLSNLLVNALDAMQEGGSLKIRVATAHQWTDGSEGVRITVGDNGSGIPREALGRIFEPFYTTKDFGTGLGLWVSNGIVRKHGGSIRVRSRIEPRHRGTVFSVFLPAAREEVGVCLGA